jgi:hypothetical protein
MWQWGIELDATPDSKQHCEPSPHADICDCDHELDLRAGSRRYGSKRLRGMGRSRRV